MPEISRTPFRKTKILEVQIDEFLDTVSEGAMSFEQGVRHYVDHGVDAEVEHRLAQIGELEARGDRLRRTIETTLFTEMLIPDARGDVLSLLDDLDHLLDRVKANFLDLVIQKPEFPPEFLDDVRELVAVAVKAIDATVLASRAYFRDPGSVRDHIHKIGYWESEADRIGLRLAKRIFDSDLPLEVKMFLRQGLTKVDKLANVAEDVGDRLAIYAVKRLH